MGKHIVFIGGGAVGGFVAGHLTRSGQDVTVVDSWCEHVEYMKANGLHLIGAQGDEHTVRVNAVHIGDVQRFITKPVDIAIISTKSYDTEWATMLIKQYLAPQGFVVSMQNGINEERIAGVVGWGKTVGCVLSTIGVNCFKPGHVKRIREPEGDKSVFRVGELHGRVTTRATELVSILNAEEMVKALRQRGVTYCAEVTKNLWGERWTKLAANSITHALQGATGITNREVFVGRGTAHRIGIKLAAEAVAVGRAQGYELSNMLGIAPDHWCAADGGDAVALKIVQDGLAAFVALLVAEPSRSSTGRDVDRGRRSETEFTNGLVAAKGEEVGVPAPTHVALNAIMRQVDSGRLKPDPKNMENILR